jgi:hypothetical protein
MSDLLRQVLRRLVAESWQFFYAYRNLQQSNMQYAAVLVCSLECVSPANNWRGLQEPLRML